VIELFLDFVYMRLLRWLGFEGWRKILVQAKFDSKKVNSYSTVTSKVISQ
jgi:hypothetical protein